MATTAQRLHMQAVMRMLVANERLIHYRASRTDPSPIHMFEQELVDTFAEGGQIVMDCSEAATLVCKLAGLRDPNGMDYNGYGNSASLYQKAKRRYTEPGRAKMGALCVFGPAGADHAAVVFAGGNDPMMFSHGQEAGPLLVRFSAQKASHRSPATFLSIQDL